ncbi:VanW family protein [Roseiflexus castenholzii]|uniref:VanW family protein n=1 Tax=Roseiflexus castenholzii (strain DSM 13941 / HLO8) TaxID=383372 RepID=A7NFF3_ROSCS|nr:VanW family protein [Roseiflexus castenholzii]ABU56175.1 VanW family protein [Roseiflexus castenholzii DSM 13941]
MSEKYYQEYGPIRRRKGEGRLLIDEPPPELPPEPPTPKPPRRTPPVRPRRAPVIGVLLVILALGVALYFAQPFITDVIAADRAMPGVSIRGVPVGGMSREDIQNLLMSQHEAFLQTPLTLVFEGREWQPSLDDLGVQFDGEQTASLALGIGRTGSPLHRIEELWALQQEGGVDIAPRLRVDASRLQRYLTNLAGEIEQPPRDAALSIAAGKVLPASARAGRQLLVDATALDILRALQSLEPRTVPLRTRILEPTLADDDIAAAVADAELLLSRPLELRQGERRWTWDQERIAEMLTISIIDGRMFVDLDQARLERAVARLAQFVDSPSAEPRVAFRNGRLHIVEPGRDGLRLEQPEAAEAIRRALRTQEHIVELPVEVVRPQITAETLPSLGIVELVAEGKSSFAGSAEYRITNIKAGADRMNGVLIPPGAEFSFNTQLGAVDAEHGFVQGYAVIGNRTQLEWGGGVCQVSTTVFRAAFWAGLPITERHAHPFYISWYDAFSFPDQAAPGMDATIYTGVQDLKFVNDTGHWLLMETIADTNAQVLSVRLYGTRPDRRVAVVGPEIANIVAPPAQAVYVNDPSLPVGTVRQTDRARRGMDIKVYRVITEGGVQRTPELFFTRFKAWPDVFVRGTRSP